MFTSIIICEIINNAICIFILNSFGWNNKTDKLQIILLEEGEFTDHNYELMQSALEYWIDKNGKLFLIVDSLITLNNIITDSQNLFLRDVNVKPAGFDKMYLDKTLIESALYQLFDKFNDRKLTQYQFSNIFFRFDTSF